MLYIASALTPTPILGSLRVPALTNNHTSLVIAKPDRIEVWDIAETGLVFVSEMEMWGTVVGIEQVVVEGSRPHVLVLLSPPEARLLLLAFNTTTSKLVVTSSTALTPPTPTLRQAEFFSAMIAQDRVVLVSLWIGVISCIEIESDKGKGKKRRGSVVPGLEDEAVLKIRDNFNINVREHNLLHLSFLPNTSFAPIVSFLWLSANNELRLQIRSLSLSEHFFRGLSKSVDVVCPTDQHTVSEDSDFNAIPFSCPAARRVVSGPSALPGGDMTLLVIGDEHSVLYTVDVASPESSPRASRKLPAASSPTSPRTSARRSPQHEMASSSSKRRKSSMGAKAVNTQTDKGSWKLKPVFRVRQGFGTVLASTVIVDECTRASVIIGDEAGSLTEIGWEFERGAGEGKDGRVKVLKAAVGHSSPPSALTYLDSGYVFVASAVADSVVLKLPDQVFGADIKGASKKSVSRVKGDQGDTWEVVYEGQTDQTKSGNGVELMERWMNVAPVKDFCVVADDNGAMSHLILASGASSSNSLRVVRSGVGLEEIINIQGLEGVQAMWPITDSSGVSRLLVSSATTTSLLDLTSDISITPVAEAISGTPTIAASICPGADILVQVTPRGLYLWSDVASASPEAVMEVERDTEIVCAQLTKEWVVLGMRGGGVKIFKVERTGFNLEAMSEVNGEISAVAIMQLPGLTSPVLAISTWTNSILLSTLSQLAAGITLSALSESGYATSLQFKHPTGPYAGHLLAGLSDGRLVIYDLESGSLGDDWGISVKSKKTSSLGTRPVVLSPCESQQQGDERIFSVGLTERMSVIFESKERIEMSSINSKDIIAVASIASSSGPTFAILSHTTGLSLVNITSLKKLHVQTCDSESQSTNKITYMPRIKAAACGVTERRLLKDGSYDETNMVQIRDAATLKLHASFPLREREQVTALQVVGLEQGLLAVGTAILPPDSDEIGAWDDGNLAVVKKGRVLLLEVSNRDGEWDVKVSWEASTVGAVYALEDLKAPLGGARFAVAAGSKLIIYGTDTFIAPNTLTQSDTWSSAYIASHLLKLEMNGNDLVVGDSMRSVSVLHVDDGPGCLFAGERDMATHGVVAMEEVKDRGPGIIIADAHSNIMTFRLGDRLEKAANFGLHEEISRFRKGSLLPSSSAPDVITPDVLFATREGRLGVVGELTTSAARTLDDLQRNMSKVWRGPGDVAWRNWRRAGTELVGRDTAGFIDGDFTQKFLDTEFFSPAEQDKILQGSSTHEHIVKLGPKGKESASLEDVLRTLEAASGVH